MKRKIWIWNHDAMRMFADEGGRHYWFAEKLLSRGSQPVIFCSNINHFNGEIRKIDGLYEIDYVNDIPFVFVKTTEYAGNGFSRIKNWISFYRGLFKIYKSVMQELGAPDVILASSVHPLTVVAGIQIAKKLKVPCIGEIRDLWPEAIFTVGKAKEHGVMGRLLRTGEYWMYRHANALIFTKEGDIDYLKEHKWLREQGGKVDEQKCYYINNGIDFAKYMEQIATKRISDSDLENGKLHVVYTGTIRKVNNVELIVEAARLLQNEEEIDFLIYGEGDYRSDLEERAQRDGLLNIKFKGNVSKQSIPYILSRSYVNLLNYSQKLYNWKRGNSSNKLFEYLASGKPVISTVKMGYDILEKHHCGFSLEECTPKCLAEMVAKVKNIPKEEYEQMGIRAKEAAKEFDFEKLTDKLEQVISFVEENKK